MSKPRILFMGTPEFAVPSLAALVEHGYPVVGVVTQPDRPRGRGRETAAPPVKVFAEQHRLPVLQPEHATDDSFLKQFEALAPDLVALAAFGQILPGTMSSPPRRWAASMSIPRFCPGTAAPRRSTGPSSGARKRRA